MTSRYICAAGAALLSLACYSTGFAEAPAPKGQLPAAVSLPNSRQFDFTSRVNGQDYRIQVALPLVPPPEGGYPVLYVLDGYAYFASATEAVRANGNAPNVVVVGIGYPLTETWSSSVLHRHFRGENRPTGLLQVTMGVGLERTFDLTPPASDAVLADQLFPKNAPKQLSSDVGGVGDFLRVIETEVKPRVQALTTIDRSNQVLFGHSLGGLAVLHALFVEPNAFRTYIIASPSIWFADRIVLKDEAKFDTEINSGQAHPRVLVTVGASEPDFGRFRMIKNGRELVARLKSLPGQPPFEVADYDAFAGQNHGISPWSALADGIIFAFQKH